MNYFNFFVLISGLLLTSCSTIFKKDTPNIEPLILTKFYQAYLSDSTVQYASTLDSLNDKIIDFILDSTKTIDIKASLINALDTSLIDSAFCRKVESKIFWKKNIRNPKYDSTIVDTIDINLYDYDAYDIFCLAYLRSINKQDYTNNTVRYFEYALLKLPESVTVNMVYMLYKVQYYYKTFKSYAAYRYFKKKSDDFKTIDLDMNLTAFDLINNKLETLGENLDFEDQPALNQAKAMGWLKSYQDTLNILDQYYSSFAYSLHRLYLMNDDNSGAVLYTEFAKVMTSGMYIGGFYPKLDIGDYYLAIARSYLQLELYEKATQYCHVIINIEEGDKRKEAQEILNKAMTFSKYYKELREYYDKMNERYQILENIGK